MLDKSKDFGEVCGHPYAVYYQKGKHFNSAGQEININSGKVIERVVPDTPPVAAPDVDPVFTAPETTGVDETMVTTGVDETMVTTGVDSPVALEDLPWQTLKKRVEESGGVWADKKQAVAYLRGLE